MDPELPHCLFQIRPVGEGLDGVCREAACKKSGTQRYQLLKADSRSHRLARAAQGTEGKYTQGGHQRFLFKLYECP